jgi:1-pyrroline-5-carboxylate dehydrogenase
MVADMEAVTRVPVPFNEPVRQYSPGSADREALKAKIKELSGQRAELTMTIGGRKVTGEGERVAVVQPHNFRHVLGDLANATDSDVTAAIAAAGGAAKAWRELPFDDRAAVFLRAADLLAGPWRATLNAATVLGQSKSVFQAEVRRPGRRGVHHRVLRPDSRRPRLPGRRLRGDARPGRRRRAVRADRLDPGH